MSEQELKIKHAIDAMNLAYVRLLQIGDESIDCHLAVKALRGNFVGPALDRINFIKTNDREAIYQIETARLCIESVQRID